MNSGENTPAANSNAFSATQMSPEARVPSPTARPSTSTSFYLTPSEIESLRQDKKESGEYFRKRWAHLRPKA